MSKAIIEGAQTWKYEAHGPIPPGVPEEKVEAVIRSVLSWGDGLREYIRETKVTAKKVLVMGQREWKLVATGTAPAGLPDTAIEAWVRSCVNWNDTVLPFMKQTTVTVGAPVNGPHLGIVQ